MRFSLVSFIMGLCVASVIAILLVEFFLSQQVEEIEQSVEELGATMEAANATYQVLLRKERLTVDYANCTILGLTEGGAQARAVLELYRDYLINIDKDASVFSATAEHADSQGVIAASEVFSEVLDDWEIRLGERNCRLLTPSQ